jgi:hypothetical protein
MFTLRGRVRVVVRRAVMDRGDHLAGASGSARQASVMPAIPVRPASPAAGRCRKCPPEAAAVRWSPGSAVDGAGRMTSAAAGRACGCAGGCCAEAPVMIRSLSGDPWRDPRKAPARSPVTPACAVVPRSLPGSRGARPRWRDSRTSLLTCSPLTGAGQRGSPICDRWAVQSLRTCSPFLIVACAQPVRPWRRGKANPMRCNRVLWVDSCGRGVATVTGCGDGRWPARPWHAAPRR